MLLLPWHGLAISEPFSVFYHESIGWRFDNLFQTMVLNIDVFVALYYSTSTLSNLIILLPLCDTAALYHSRDKNPPLMWPY